MSYMTTTAKTTNSAYIRWTGRNPRGFGRWCFQASTSDRAMDADLVGEPTFITANFTEARAAAVRHFGNVEFVAVLP